MALNSSFLLLLFFNQKKSSERGDYSKQPLGKGTCWESRRGILQSSLRLIAKGWGTRRKNQISCDPPLIAAPLLEWCYEEKKIFPPPKALMKILELLMREQPWGSWVGMINVFLRESAKPGSRENLSTPRGNLQPAADSFMGKKPEWQEAKSPPQHAESEFGSLWTRNDFFSFLYPRSQESKSGPCNCLVQELPGWSLGFVVSGSACPPHVDQRLHGRIKQT